MAIVFPTSLDALSNPASGALLSTGHAAQHADVNDAIEALETRVGITASADATSLTKRIAVLEALPAGGGVSIGSAPQLNGFTWWSQDIAVSGALSNAPTVVSGALQMVRVYFPKALTVTNLHLFCVTGGTVTGSYGGLYTAAGALLSQSTNQGACTSSTIKTFPLGAAQAVTANTAYYAAFFFVHSVSCTFTCDASNQAFYNLNTAAPNLRVAVADTGLTTTMPANFGAQTSGTKAYWAAVS